MMTAAHYRTLQDAAAGAGFRRDYDELRRDYDELRRDYDELRRDFYATRAYFDNTHEPMTDVWDFPVVTNEDRHGHATPKPVAMMERAIKSSSRPGDVIIEPFGGTGATLMAAETTGRACHTMELQPQYVDVIVRRWQTHTGREAVLQATGQTFAQATAARA